MHCCSRSITGSLILWRFTHVLSTCWAVKSSKFGPNHLETYCFSGIIILVLAMDHGTSKKSYRKVEPSILDFLQDLPPKYPKIMPNSLHRFPFKWISHWGLTSQKSAKIIKNPPTQAMAHQSPDCHRPWPCIPAPEASPPGGCRWSHCLRSPRPCRSPRAQGFPRLHLQPDHLEVAKEKGDPFLETKAATCPHIQIIVYTVSHTKVCALVVIIYIYVCVCTYFCLFIYAYVYSAILQVS